MGHASLVDRALGTAFRAHAGQTDKLGEPYIGHVVRVASGVEGEDRICAALLHDVVEDTAVTLDDLLKDFPDRIVSAVDALTKRPGESRDAYLARVAADPFALDVKLADIADNSLPRRLDALPLAEAARLRERYRTSADTLLHLRG